MNIVLPEGYRHVARIRKGRDRDDVHIVVNQHAGREGYVTTTLCGIDVDTKHKAEGELFKEWGTLPEGDREQRQRQGIWNHDCDKCVSHIRTAAFIAERFTESYMRRVPELGIDPELVVAVVEELMRDGVVR